MENMMTSNIDDLLKVLEEIRSEEYPEIPKEVIEQIARTQFNNQDNRSKARNDTLQIINDYLNSVTIGEK